MPSGQSGTNYAISRRGRNFFFALGLVAFILLVLLDNIFIKNIKYSRVTSQEQINPQDAEKYHNKTFTVINVIDGDTIDINIPDNENEYTRIRLLGIDALETNTENGPMYFGRQATEFVQKLILGNNVHIFLDQENDTRGKYGRLLAYVQISDGSFLNEVLLNEGLVYADLRFRHSFYNKYKQIESRARSSNNGLWENVTPDQIPQWLQDRENM